MPLAAEKRGAVIDIHVGDWDGGIAVPLPPDDGMCIVSGIWYDMVVWVKVCGINVPLVMSRYFGHDGGCLIDFL